MMANNRSVPVLDVFISYAWANNASAERIQKRLEQSGFSVWRDKTGIYPREHLEEKIRRSIASSNNFLFLISDASLFSYYANWELALARQNKKKIIGVLVEKLSGNNPNIYTRQRLKEINRRIRRPEDRVHAQSKVLRDAEKNLSFLDKRRYIDLTDPQGFRKNLAVLKKDIKNYFEIKEMHARLVTYFEKWINGFEKAELLLSNNEIKETDDLQDLIKQEQLAEPEITSDHLRFIRKSRENEKRIQGRNLLIVIGLTIVISILAVTAYVQRNIAIARRIQGLSFQLSSQAKELVPDNYQLAALLAAQAYSFEDTPEAELALSQVLEVEPRVLRFINGDDYSYVYSGVAISPDGKLIAGAIGAANQIYVWDTETGDQLFFFQAETFDPRMLLFSPDNSYLIAGSHRGSNQDPNKPDLLIWDLDANTQSWLSIFNRGLQAMSIDPQSKLLAVGGDEKVALLDLKTKKETLELVSGHSGSIYSLKFSNDGRKLALAAGELVTWETDQWTETGRFSNDMILVGIDFSDDDRTLFSIGISPRLNLVDVDTNHQIASWDIETGQILNSRIVNGPTHGPYPFYDSMSKTLIVANGTGLRIYDPISLEEVENQIQVRISSAGYWTQISKNAKMVTLATDSIVVYDLAEKHRMGDTIRPYPELEPQPAILRWSSSGQIYATATSWGAQVRIWDSNKHDLLASLPENDTAYAIAFSHDDRYLASIGEHGLYLWDTKTWELVSGPISYPARAFSLEFSPNNSWLGVGDISGTGRASLFSVPNLELKGEYDIGGGASFNNLKFISDNEFVITDPLGSIKAIKITAEGDQVENLLAIAGLVPTQGIWDVNDNATRIASFISFGEGELGVGVWDLPLRFQISKTTDFKATSFTPPLVLSHDGDLMVLAFCDQNSADNCERSSAFLWETSTASKIGEISISNTYLLFPDFNMNSSILSYSDQWGTVYIWNYDSKSAFLAACEIAGRNMSLQEWGKYIGPDIPYSKTCEKFTKGSGAPVSGLKEKPDYVFTVNEYSLEIYGLPSGFSVDEAYLSFDGSEERAETYGLKIFEPLLIVNQNVTDFSYSGVVEVKLIDSTEHVTKQYHFKFETTQGSNLIFPPHGFRFFNDERVIQIRFLDAHRQEISQTNSDSISIQQSLSYTGDQILLNLDVNNGMQRPLDLLSAQGLLLNQQGRIVVPLQSGELSRAITINGIGTVTIPLFSGFCQSDYADCQLYTPVGNYLLRVWVRLKDAKGTEVKKEISQLINPVEIAKLQQVINTANLVPTDNNSQVVRPVLSDTPDYSRVANGVEIRIYNIPEGVGIGDTYLLQCRENVYSEILVENYLFALSLANNSIIEYGDVHSTIVFLSQDGFELDRDSIEWQLAPFSTTLGFPNGNRSGYVLSGADNTVSQIWVIFDEWRQNRKGNQENQAFEPPHLYVHGSGTYGQTSFPQHRFFAELSNSGISSISDIQIWGLVISENGDLIDVVAEWLGEYVAYGGLTQKGDILYGGNSNFYQLVSLSGSGRCVGPSSSNGVESVEIWATFLDNDGQSHTINIDVPVVK